jgi:hypothetical protein
MGIGSTLGGIAGTVFGPVGSTVGALAGSALEAIPSLIKTDAEKENEKRRKALQAQQDLGTLGLTEAEKQSLYTAGTNQIAGQLQQAQAQARAAGAAGMASGGGIDALRQALQAQQQAQLASEVAQRTEQQNLERRRVLDQELEERIATGAEYKRDRLEAAMALASGGLSTLQKGGQKALTQAGSMPSMEEIQKFAKFMGIDDKAAMDLIKTKSKNPAASPYIDSLAPQTAAPATGVTP